MTFEVKKSTQFKINELVVVTKAGNIDISGIYEEINIFDSIFLPVMNGKILIKVKPITFREEIELSSKKNKKPLEELSIYIKEFNGERNPNKILNAIRMLRLLESRDLRAAIKDNTPGVDTKYYYECDYCDKTTLYDFGGNTFDLLKLPASYRNNVLEEIFLLTYYGKSITIEDAKRMPVTERRWFINRISEELEKQRDYEKKEMAKARSSSKKR